MYSIQIYNDYSVSLHLNSIQYKHGAGIQDFQLYTIWVTAQKLQQTIKNIHRYAGWSKCMKFNPKIKAADINIM
jgi:hypothetical protein